MILRVMIYASILFGNSLMSYYGLYLNEIFIYTCKEEKNICTLFFIKSLKHYCEHHCYMGQTDSYLDESSHI
jgi:hypothetical protein